MGWWHVALEIRSTPRSSAAKSPSTPSRNTGTDIFSIDLAPQKPAPVSNNAPRSEIRAGGSKQDPAPPSHPHGSTQPGKTATAGSTGRKPTDSGEHKPPGDRPADSNSRPGTSADQGNTGPADAAQARQQQAARQNGAQQQSAEQQARDAAVQAAEPARANLLQILAQALDSSSDTPATGQTADEAPPAPARKDEPPSDPNQLALSVFTQALAAALGASTAATPPANTAPVPQVASDAADQLVADVRQGRGIQGSGLLSILGPDLAADAKAGAIPQTLQTAPPVTTDPGQAATDTNSAVASLMPHPGLGSHFTAAVPQSISAATELKSTVGSAAWADEVGTHLTWMTQKGLETGSLRVSPEHLGPVEVQISVQNGGASVWFGAHHPDTRAALEQALPRLREMFASQGMTLTDSGVSRESPRNQSRAASAPIAAISAQAGSEPVAVRVSLGLVDTYA
jgi:flagellar hook-length control protein FliK